jgi:Fe-S-cluster containining protein
VWRISQTLELPPWGFTRYTDAQSSAELSFALDQSERRYKIVLAKQAGDAACVFLWRTPNGHAQCGLGDLRPMACKVYPATLIDGILCVGESAGCTCRVWALAHFDLEEEERQMRSAEHERAEYALIVRRWNDLVQRGAADRQFSYIEFCNYLLNVYSDRAREADLG